MFGGAGASDGAAEAAAAAAAQPEPLGAMDRFKRRKATEG